MAVRCAGAVTVYARRMTDRARVTYTGEGRVALSGAAAPRPADEVGTGDTVEVSAAYAELLLERDDFTPAAEDAELVEPASSLGTPPTPEPVPLDLRREAVEEALATVDGDVTRLRGAALDDALRGAYGSDVDTSGSLAERQARLTAATPDTNPETTL